METQGIRNIIQEHLYKLTGNVKAIYSDDGEKDTVDTGKSDTESVGISSIHFITDGALKDLVCANLVNTSDVDSNTTYTAGSIIYVKDASKVVTSTHGTQIIYLNE